MITAIPKVGCANTAQDIPGLSPEVVAPTLGSVTVDFSTAQDVEWIHLCDDTLNDGTVLVPFLRRIITTNGVASASDYLQDGTTAYVPVGTVGPCATGGGTAGDEVEWLSLCDDTLNDGIVVVQFLRRISTVNGVDTVADLQPDGVTPYVVVGTVGPCTTSTDQPDVEWNTLCDDTLNDGTVLVPFMQRISTLNGVDTVTTFATDAVTPYVVVGSAVPCSTSTATVPVEVQTFNNEYAGPVTVTRATLLADMGVTTISELDVLVRQVNNVGDTITFTFGGNTVDVTLGGSQTFRAPAPNYLDDFSITLVAGEALNISAIGLT